MEKQNIMLALPLAVALGDGVIKRAAEEKLSDEKTRKIFGGHVWLRLLHNPGVALGAFKKYPGAVLTANSGLLGAAAGYLICLQKRPGAALAKTGLGLLIGGGLSNFIDRVRRGYVTDYFSLNFGERLKGLRRIVFNISDFCVFIGVFLCVIGKKTARSIRGVFIRK